MRKQVCAEMAAYGTRGLRPTLGPPTHTPPTREREGDGKAWEMATEVCKRKVAYCLWPLIRAVRQCWSNASVQVLKVPAHFLKTCGGP